MLDQLGTAHAQMNQHLWDHLIQVVRQTNLGTAPGGAEGKGRPMVRIPKMTMENDPEAFLNTKTSARAPDQWVAVLIPHLVRPV